MTWVSSDDSVASVDIGGTVIALSKGTATITVMTNDGSNLNASCIVTVPITYVAVDLGLSVKWATFNLGASSPEEYGGYYAWAETETKDTYTWSNYRYGSGG